MKFFLKNKNFDSIKFGVRRKKINLVWISFGDFNQFAPIAPNYIRTKIYPNKLVYLLLAIHCNLSLLAIYVYSKA